MQWVGDTPPEQPITRAHQREVITRDTRGEILNIAQQKSSILLPELWLPVARTSWCYRSILLPPEQRAVRVAWTNVRGRALRSRLWHRKGRGPLDPIGSAPCDIGPRQPVEIIVRDAQWGKVRDQSLLEQHEGFPPRH